MSQAGTVSSNASAMGFINAVDVDAHTAPGTDPVVPTAGLITITGGQVASGVVGANVIRTDSLAASTFTIEIQRSTAVAATDSTKNGVSHFNSAEFTVDASGFVSLAGGGLAVDSFAVQTGTSPVVPTGAGLVNFNGAVVAAGTNPVRTDGTGANTMALEVQITQAIAATDATKIGLAAFDSADFSVDANGFVTLSSTPNIPAYTPIATVDSPYTVTATDYYISTDSTAGPITIRFPNAPSAFREFIVKDRVGQASGNPITLTTVGGVVLIDGLTSQTLASNFSSVQLLFNGTAYEQF